MSPRVSALSLWTFWFLGRCFAAVRGSSESRVPRLWPRGTHSAVQSLQLLGLLLNTGKGTLGDNCSN